MKNFKSVRREQLIENAIETAREQLNIAFTLSILHSDSSIEQEHLNSLLLQTCDLTDDLLSYCLDYVSCYDLADRT
jgi:hypothetical protein